MSERLQRHRTNHTQIKWRAMEGVQVVGSSQCSVAFREQYSLQVSLEHGQRRWRRDEIWQTVPHSRRGHGKRTVADSGHAMEERRDRQLSIARISHIGRPMVNATDNAYFSQGQFGFFAGRRHCRERSLLMQPYSYWGGDTCPPRSAPSRLLSRLLCRLDCLLSISLIHWVTVT